MPFVSIVIPGWEESNEIKIKINTLCFLDDLRMS
jgi:hypothetical protein